MKISRCDKTGNEIDLLGQYKAYQYENTRKFYISKAKTSHKTRSNKRERNLKYKNHLKNLSNNYHRRYHIRVCSCCDEIYIKGQGYTENPKPYYKRFYRGKCSKYLKKLSNRKIRQYKDDIPNGYACHKLFDFWWELY